MPATPPTDEVVVLLDEQGRPAGTLPKAAAHHAATPFHLAFSCHVVDGTGRVLLTRRAATKPTWPATWTNACCGHPAPGETLREAVTRRLAHELGLVPARMGLAVPDFAYRAEQDGVVEHELCPVVVAEVAGDAVPAPDPSEVDGVAWTTWAALCERARLNPGSLSPWSVAQVGRLVELGAEPRAWLDTEPWLGALRLDEPPGVGAARSSTEDVVTGMARETPAFTRALQLRGEVAAVFGGPEGNDAGRPDDLRAARGTLLVARALELAVAGDRALLQRALAPAADTDLDEATAARCRGAIARSGALASVEALIEHLLTVARHRAAAPP